MLYSIKLMSAKTTRNPWHHPQYSTTKYYSTWQWEIQSVIDGIPIAFTATLARHSKLDTLSFNFKGNLIEKHKDFKNIKNYIRNYLRDPLLLDDFDEINKYFPVELQLNT